MRLTHRDCQTTRDTCHCSSPNHWGDCHLFKPRRLHSVNAACISYMEAYGLDDEPSNAGSRFAAKVRQQWQIIMDKSAPLVSLRWLIWAGLLATFALRIWYVKGFYIVAYALGIFNLNLLLGFLSPQVTVHDADCCLVLHPHPPPPRVLKPTASSVERGPDARGATHGI